MPETSKLKKIAILGGGVASITAAFELTCQPGWNALYDITIYQQGWRLGGKGASGRSVENHQPYHEPTYRIEEHGLHIFFGFYENAFRLMKQCYDELADDGPFLSIEDAFKPHSLIVIEEYINDNWVQWSFNFPPNKLLPWEGGGNFSMWEHICTIIKLMYDGFEGSNYLKSQYLVGKVSSYQAIPNWLELLAKQVEIGWETIKITSESAPLHLPDKLVQLLLNEPTRWWQWLENAYQKIGTTLGNIDLASEGTFLYIAYKLAKSMPDDPRTHRSEHHSIILKLLERFMESLSSFIESEIEQNEDTFRLLILLDLAFANIRGLLVDEVIYDGYLASLDEHDYREWLQKHGAKKTSINSAFIRVLYDLVYAFPGGNVHHPRLAAGTAIRILTTVIFQYNGAIMWKMQAGMGDTIFAPLYQVLKRRGVKFEFFHRVKQLHLDDSQQSIASISLGRQVNLKEPAREYEPLIQVKSLLCWPSEPRYEQILEGEELQQQQVNLESFWTPWQDNEISVTLNVGEDFDLVILGISLGALPFICGDLINAEKNPAHQKWANMVSQIETVPTQGGQLWLKSNLQQLGWTAGSPVVGSYVEPLDTYADMSDLIQRENWPSEHYPYNLAYFTGVIADSGIPPSSDRDFPKREQEKVEQQAIDFLENQIGNLWPKATTPENPQGLNWDLLVDLKNQQGQKRFYSQYWRVNIDPSERYVLSVPGSTKYRLKTDESGFDNLYLTGDWTDNGYNSGCVEATVMSAMQAARAILKRIFGIEYAKKIIGERDSWL
jgi:uncharacterized protein with NAD-binding domain and iron-sulfur cluster